MTKVNRPSPLGVMCCMILLVGFLLAPGCSPKEFGGNKPISPVRQMYEQRCGNCHEAYPPYAYSDGEWPGILESMQSQAGMRDEEKQAVLRWLKASN